jgi:hypothetical protein
MNELVDNGDAFASTEEWEIIEAVRDSIRLSSLGTDQDILRCLYEEAKCSNSHRAKILSEWWCRDKIVGLSIAHEQTIELVRTGSIEDPADRAEDIPRSTLILTESKLNRILGENGAPAFPALEALDFPLGQAEEELGVNFPMIRRPEWSRYERLYRQSARHLLTHGTRAVLLWQMFARSLRGYVGKLDNIKPKSEPKGGRDGGIDDLSSTEAGLLATQVKGGSTYKGAAKPSAMEEATHFFHVNGNSQLKDSARHQRAELWPVLSNPCEGGAPGMTLDDALHLHYLAVGKRVTGGGVVRGETKLVSNGVEKSILRAMFVTGLDVIVLKNSILDCNRTRIDLSEASNETRSKLMSLGLVEPDLLDSPV